MKLGKAAGPDEITIEMLKPLEELRILVLTKLLNGMYNTEHIQIDLSKSMFVAIPKILRQPNVNYIANSA